MVFFVVYPKYEELNLLKERIASKGEELQFREEYLEELYKASDKLENYGDQLEIIKTTFPSGSSFPILFDFLQKSGSQSGLVVKSVKASEADAENNIKKIGISVQANGSYSAFKNFIIVLEESARLINVNSFSFGAPSVNEETEETNVDPIFNFNLEATTYSY
jgi:Tfp pilus assembly protein PilO